MENELYIPMGVKTENELFSGFGNKELLQAIIGTLIAGFIAFIVWLISGNTIYCLYNGVKTLAFRRNL